MIAPNRLFRNQVSRSDLERAAGDFLQFLDKERIFSIEDLNKRNNAQYVLTPGVSDYIEIILTNILGDPTNSLKYVCPEVGAIIRGINNLLTKDSQSTKFFVKSTLVIPGYIILDEDKFGNLSQYKSFVCPDFIDGFKNELKALTRLEH
jgi:hypothetical protein